MQKKILFVGNDTSTRYALAYAKEQGYYTIITDYNSPEAEPVKKETDDYWMIDVTDVDAIVKKCQEIGIDAVYAGNSEFCLDKAKAVCDRLGLPFYASDLGWECARNKILFKEICEECGLAVPKKYELDGTFTDRAVLDSIVYPVVVKPSDSCGRQGLSIVHSETDLKAAYEHALACSANKQIVVEQYMTGTEITAYYVVIDGVPYVTDFEYILKQDIGYPDPVLIVALIFGKNKTDFQEQCGEGIQKYFDKIGWKTGPCFLQAFYQDGKYYFTEFGGRIDGIGIWVHQKHSSGTSEIELQMDVAMGRTVTQETGKLLSGTDRNVLAYGPWLKPRKLAVKSDSKLITDIPGTEIVLDNYQVGDTVQESFSMKQMAYYLEIVGKDTGDLIGKVEEINRRIDFRDEKGEDMVMRFDGFDLVREIGENHR